jgi:hypothetical protein
MLICRVILICRDIDMSCDVDMSYVKCSDVEIRVLLRLYKEPLS